MSEVTNNAPQPLAKEDLALVIYIGGIVVTVCAMVLAVVLAGRRLPNIVVYASTPAVSSAAVLAASAPPGPAPGIPAALPPTQTEQPPAAQIALTSIDTVPGVEDLFDPAWDAAPALEVQLLPQNIVRPILASATIQTVNVQALRDSGRIAWRVSWADPDPAANVDVSHFSDGVAIQFPLQQDTPFMMGSPDKPVRILHWKALWQKDRDEGFQDVQTLHPNFVNDFYWFASGAFPFPVRESFNDPNARQWLIALSAGNPMADQQRPSPVEEIVAQGMGSATHVQETPSRAHGAWHEGRWTVVIDRPLSQGDPLSAAIQSGASNAIAIAVWDGSSENVGGRKHFSNWVPVGIKP
jgi:hypothetical protein